MIKHVLKHFFLIILIISLGIFVASNKVQRIQCYKNNSACDVVTAGMLEPLKGTSFFFSDSIEIVKSQHNNTLPFRIVKIHKELPNTITLFLEDEPPLYVIFEEQQQSITHGVSDNGSFVSFDPAQTMPIVYIQTLEHASIPEHIHAAVKTIVTQTSGKNIQTIRYISPTEIILQYTNTPPLIITEDVPVYALQHIEKIMYTVQSQSMQQPIKEIDLRFRLPVLRTET